MTESLLSRVLLAESDRETEKLKKAPRGFYVLTVPLPPNAANSRRHWRVALRDKKAYWNTLNTLTWRVPPKPFRTARIHVHLYVWNLMDADNAMARLKPLCDWLKGVWIVDDSPKHLVWEGIPEQTIDRKHQRAVITLTGEP